MPFPLPRTVVTRRAEDLVALLPAIEDLFRDREGQFLDERRADLAGEEGDVFLERAASDRAVHELARARTIREERARAKRLVLRLVVHVLTAARDEEETRERRDDSRCWQGSASYGSTSLTALAPKPFMNSRVRALSNFGSVASMARKNRSWLARANAGTLNTGW